MQGLELVAGKYGRLTGRELPDLGETDAAWREAEQRWEQERQSRERAEQRWRRAEQDRRQEREARQAAEARIVELEARLRDRDNSEP